MVAGHILLDNTTFLVPLKSHLTDNSLQVKLAIFVQAGFIQQPVSLDGKYLTCKDYVSVALCVPCSC